MTHPVRSPLVLALACVACVAVHAQSSSVAKIASVPPRPAPPAIGTTAAPAPGLPSPTGLQSRFPAGLTAATLAAPGTNVTPPPAPAGGGAVVVPPATDPGTAVATNVMGAGAAQPLAMGPGPYTAVDVARAFLGADRNRDGELSRAEARQLTLGSASFEELDRNHDGIVTRWEFDDAMGR